MSYAKHGIHTLHRLCFATPHAACTRIESTSRQRYLSVFNLKRPRDPVGNGAPVGPSGAPFNAVESMLFACC